MPHFVGTSKNNVAVYVDLFQSAAAKHIAHEPHLLTLASKVIQHTNLIKPVVNLEYDMGCLIGYDSVVEAADDAAIFYAQVAQDNVYTRFTKSGKPQPTSHLSVMLQQSHEATSYVIHNIWIGRFTPPRPGSVEETVKSRPYWQIHAHLFGNQPIQPRSLTKACPY